MLEEEVDPSAIPLRPVAAFPSARPPLVVPRLALPIPLDDGRTPFTDEVRAAAVGTDRRRPRCHGQATGRFAAWPFTRTAPAAIDVPPFFVVTSRTYRLKPA